MTFRHKGPVNLEEVYTKFNFFVLVHWKGMKLGRYMTYTYVRTVLWHRVNLSYTTRDMMKITDKFNYILQCKMFPFL